MTSIRWGILGTGKIARKFAEGLSVLPDAELTAVGSRAPETANAFANRFDVPRRHPTYEDLANDPDIDAIYIATPHPFHRENSILCLKAGKAVLCEKPFTINAAEAEAVIRVARNRGVFLMEAMWTRFLPVMNRGREWLVEGAVGEVCMLIVDYGFRAEVDPEGRLFNLNLGGGSLLDVGIYTVSLTSMVLGPYPDTVKSVAHLGETGVDEQAAVILGYEGDRLAVLVSTIRTETSQKARIFGTDGQIEIDPPFHRAPGATLRRGGKREERIELPLGGNGFHHEAAEVMRCLREGRLESEIMPLDETLGIMAVLDRIRSQWGLKYPMEQEG